MWGLSGNKCGILPTFRFKYNHLSSHLKRCFSFYAIFPKNFEFDKKELIRLWIANGLVQQSKCDRRKIQNEDLGNDYF